MKWWRFLNVFFFFFFFLNPESGLLSSVTRIIVQLGSVGEQYSNQTGLPLTNSFVSYSFAHWLTCTFQITRLFHSCKLLRNSIRTSVLCIHVAWWWLLFLRMRRLWGKLRQLFLRLRTDHSQPTQLLWIKGLCVFSCNLPPALLATLKRNLSVIFSSQYEETLISAPTVPRGDQERD